MQKIIDDADRRILRELQRDSSRTVTEIAEAVGLSHAPCWRRIQRLRSEGIILGEAAIVDRSKLGFDLEFCLEHLTGQPDLGEINSMTVMATIKEGQIPI